MFKELIRKARSCRRFYGDKEIPTELFDELVEYARLSPSGSNLQPLKYIIVQNKSTRDTLYEELSWAGYLSSWDGPEPSERPTGYIVMLRDNSIAKKQSMDEGIAAQSIFLGASYLGLGGCMIKSFKKDPLIQLLEVEERFDIALVIALGYPKEEIVLETMTDSSDVKYYRDEQNVHHVPKRSIQEVIIRKI